MPAVLILPKGDEEYKEFVKGIMGEQIGDEIDDLKVVLSPLCSWCLIKRGLGMRPEVFKVLVNNGDFGQEEIESKRVFIPSVSHIASYKKYEAFKNEELECKEIRGIISLWKYYETYPEDKRCLILKDPEILWFGRTRDKTLSPYYALIRADTDYLGFPHQFLSCTSLLEFLVMYNLGLHSFLILFIPSFRSLSNGSIEI